MYKYIFKGLCQFYCSTGSLSCSPRRSCCPGRKLPGPSCRKKNSKYIKQEKSVCLILQKGSRNSKYTNKKYVGSQTEKDLIHTSCSIFCPFLFFHVTSRFNQERVADISVHAKLSRMQHFTIEMFSILNIFMTMLLRSSPVKTGNFLRSNIIKKMRICQKLLIYPAPILSIQSGYFLMI